MIYTSTRDRYLNDPAFRHAVDAQLAAMESGVLSPGDFAQAVTLATAMYIDRNGMERFWFDDDPEVVPDQPAVGRPRHPTIQGR